MASSLREKIKRRLRLSGVPEPGLPEVVLAGLEAEFRDRLLSMYRGEAQRGEDGKIYEIDGKTLISPEEGMWLFELCRSAGAEDTLEIGMAYGYSTLFFLAALAANGKGRHTSIDFTERTAWHGIAIEHARELGMAERLRFIEDTSQRAAADLGREGAKFDVIFIDGGHKFDEVLTDFTLYAPLCRVGGRIVFDDLWLDSVQAVLMFIRANRPDFVEMPANQPNARVIRKVGEDTRNWDHFKAFKMPP